MCRHCGNDRRKIHGFQADHDREIHFTKGRRGSGGELKIGASDAMGSPGGGKSPLESPG